MNIKLKSTLLSSQFRIFSKAQFRINHLSIRGLVGLPFIVWKFKVDEPMFEDRRGYCVQNLVYPPVQFDFRLRVVGVAGLRGRD